MIFMTVHSNHPNTQNGLEERRPQTFYYNVGAQWKEENHYSKRCVYIIEDRFLRGNSFYRYSCKTPINIELHHGIESKSSTKLRRIHCNWFHKLFYILTQIFLKTIYIPK